MLPFLELPRSRTRPNVPVFMNQRKARCIASESDTRLRVEEAVRKFVSPSFAPPLQLF